MVAITTAEEYLAEARKNYGRAREILTDPDRAEELEHVEALMTDAEKYKKAALHLQTIGAAETVLADFAQAQEKETKDRERSKEFESWKDFLNAVWASGQPNGRFDQRLKFFKERDPERRMETKDMVENTGAGGGFLVPTEYYNQLQAVLAEENIVRQRATIIPMNRRTVLIPVLDQTGTTVGRPHWFGGIVFYYTGEGAEKTESDPEFRQVELCAHELVGYTRASDVLVDDSFISLDAFFQGPLGFAGGIAWMEEYAFLQGTGAGQPLGIVNAPVTITVARQAAGAVGYVDLCNMMEEFLARGGRGVWMISQSLMSDIIQLNGPAGNPSYIWAQNAADKIPGMMFGMPVIWSEMNSVLGTAGDVALCNWPYYLIGDRQSFTVESTKFDRWRHNQTSWKVVHRYDGQPWLSTPLTYQDGTTQVSPFVILGDAAT